MSKLFWNSLWGMPNEIVTQLITPHFDQLFLYMFALTCKRFYKITRTSSSQPININSLLKKDVPIKISMFFLEHHFLVSKLMTATAAAKYFKNYSTCSPNKPFVMHICPNSEKRLKELFPHVDKTKILKINNKIQLLQYSYNMYVNENFKFKIITGIIVPMKNGFYHSLFNGKDIGIHIKSTKLVNDPTIMFSSLYVLFKHFRKIETWLSYDRDRDDINICIKI